MNTPTTKERLLARHREVRAAFIRMRDTKKYRYTFIISELAKKHHYSEKRVEEIIAMDDDNPLYGNPNQLQMFDDE